MGRAKEGRWEGRLDGFLFATLFLLFQLVPPPSISSCFAQTTYGRRGGRGEGGGGVRGVGGGVSGCVCVAYLSTRPAANRNDHCLFRFLKIRVSQSEIKPRKIVSATRQPRPFPHLDLLSLSLSLSHLCCPTAAAELPTPVVSNTQLSHLFVDVKRTSPIPSPPPLSSPSPIPPLTRTPPLPRP